MNRPGIPIAIAVLCCGVSLIGRAAIGEDRRTAADANRTESKQQGVAPAAQAAKASHAGTDEPLAVFQLNIQRTGYLQDGKLLPKHPKVVWVSRLDSLDPAAGPTAPVVSRGTVYFGDGKGRVYALNTAGKKKWVYKSGQRIMMPPIVTGEKLYFASSKSVECLSCATGKRLWIRELPLGAAESSPLLVDDILFVASPDGFIYGLNAANGNVRWRASLMSNVPTSPKDFPSERLRGREPCRPTLSASDGQSLFQSVFDQSRIVAVDRKSGAQRWSFAAGGWVHGSPTVAGNYVFIGAADGYLYCLDRPSGKLAWKFRTPSRIEAGPAVAKGRVYFSSCNGQIFCADVEHGRQLWSHQTQPDDGGDASIYCAPLVTDEAVYIAAMEGQAYALDVATGEEVWNLRPSASRHSLIASTGLATDGRRLYLATWADIQGSGEFAIVAIGDESP